MSTVITCHECGRDIRMILPRLIHAQAFSYYMRENVHDYIRKEAAKWREPEYIVDVGAHVGVWTIPYKMIFPSAKILCIEPSSFNFEYLRENIKPFHPDITAIRVAAGPESGRLRIACPTPLQKYMPNAAESGTVSRYGNSDILAEIVPMKPLDEIVERRVDWMKMDIEGYEIPALKGAERILKEDRPILQVEVRESNQQMGGRTAFELLQYIDNRGYYIAGEVRGDFVFVPLEARGA